MTWLKVQITCIKCSYLKSMLWVTDKMSMYMYSSCPLFLSMFAFHATNWDHHFDHHHHHRRRHYCIVYPPLVINTVQFWIHFFQKKARKNWNLHKLHEFLFFKIQKNECLPSRLPTFLCKKRTIDVWLIAKCGRKSQEYNMRVSLVQLD